MVGGEAALVILICLLLIAVIIALLFATGESFLRDVINNNCPDKVPMLIPITSSALSAQAVPYCQASYYMACYPHDTSWVPVGWELHDLGRGFILSQQNHAILVFRGTFSISDLFVDFHSTQTDATALGIDGRVHAGYLHAYLQLRVKIKRCVENRELCIMGHSMGAALALLAAVDMPHARTACLAPPKIGDLEFQNSIASLFASRVGNLHIIINNADVISISPAGLFETFFHPPDHFQTRFTDERGSWTLNHSLNVYKHDQKEQ